ncbi:hypothetical protein [Methylobacterium sp. AMS5]|uniref:hypothetical protein n=1 Tax=Methylobacterium sp. AMS5 TaxID=925818 RepID=UPI00130DFEBE|nr:hypothetical protein [Methylobacterium sp. AMS5]
MTPMKERVRTAGRIRPLRLAFGGESRASPRRTIETSVDEPAIATLVPELQFDALPALLDKPPMVFDELRREVAQRRWRQTSRQVSTAPEADPRPLSSASPSASDPPPHR